MELACYEDSVLSQEVTNRFGPGSAVGSFNGIDLEALKGVRLAKDLVQKHRPANVWLSCACSPCRFLQKLNRATLDKAAASADKRAGALRE